jgi:hypothetical protein
MLNHPLCFSLLYHYRSFYKSRSCLAVLKIRSGLSQNLRLQLNFAGHDGLLCFGLLYRQSLGESQFHLAGFEMQPTDLSQNLKLLVGSRNWQEAIVGSRSTKQPFLLHFENLYRSSFRPAVLKI